MYHVHVKRLTSSQLRLHLAEALDTAERGEPMVIERRGTRFLLRVAPVNSRPRHAGRKIIDIVDPAVADGEWTWSWRAGNLAFRDRRRRR